MRQAYLQEFDLEDSEEVLLDVESAAEPTSLNGACHVLEGPSNVYATIIHYVNLGLNLEKNNRRTTMHHHASVAIARAT